MSGLVVVACVVAAVFVGFGLADQRWLYQRSARWRYANGEVPDPSGAYLVFQRVVLLLAAAGMVFVGVSMWHTDSTVNDQNAWSDEELRAAVHKAAPDLGTAVVTDGEDRDDHSSDIADSVGHAAGDAAPSYDVQVERASDSGDDYEIRADGADAVFCMSVYLGDSAGGFVPGAKEAHIEQVELKGRVRNGAC